MDTCIPINCFRSKLQVCYIPGYETRIEANYPESRHVCVCVCGLYMCYIDPILAQFSV